MPDEQIFLFPMKPTHVFARAEDGRVVEHIPCVLIERHANGYATIQTTNGQRTIRGKYLFLPGEAPPAKPRRKYNR